MIFNEMIMYHAVYIATQLNFFVMDIQYKHPIQVDGDVSFPALKIATACQGFVMYSQNRR